MNKTLLKSSLLIVALMSLSACSHKPVAQQNAVVEPEISTGLVVEESSKVSETPVADTQGEEDFNNSGRAKAIESETDLWPVFNDAVLGLSVQYPQDATLAAQDEFIRDADKVYYKVESKDFVAGDLPWDLSVEEMQKNVEQLAGSKFGINHDSALELSKKVKSVGRIFAQDYVVMSRFEVCNVTMERKLLFYYNNKQIIISSYAPIKLLQSLMPEYFVIDKENCGEPLRWDMDKQDAFYQLLVDKKAPQEIQDWYDNFDKMSETVVFSQI